MVDALGDNDLEAALTALIQAPAITLDGFLHGGYGPSIGGLVGFGDSLRVVSGGLLGGGLQIVGKDADGNRATIIPGTGWVLQRLQQDILKAITRAPPKKSVSADMATLVAAQSGQTPSPTTAVADAHGAPDTSPESGGAATETTDAATNGSSGTESPSSASNSSDSSTPVSDSDTDYATADGESNPTTQGSTGAEQSASAVTPPNGTASNGTASTSQSSKDTSSRTASKTPSSGTPSSNRASSNGASSNRASGDAASAGAATGGLSAS